MYYRVEFEGAIEYLRHSYDGLGHTLGPNHDFHHSRLYCAYTLTGISELDEACRVYEEIWSLWTHYTIPNIRY